MYINLYDDVHALKIYFCMHSNHSDVRHSRCLCVDSAIMNSYKIYGMIKNLLTSIQFADATSIT